MRRKNEQPIGEVLKDMFREYGLERKYQQAEIGYVWNNLLGPSVAHVTGRVILKNGRLTVYLSSSLVKHELNMMHTRLISGLNEAMGEELVREIQLI
jgi:predicted nucleic acid-binding Zn ribbon protein